MTWQYGSAASALALLLGACANADELADADPYESAEGNPPTGSGPGDESQSRGDDNGDGDGEPDSGDEAGPLDIPPDTELACDPWAQDCPADEKCTWETVDGVAQTHCVPVEPDAKQPGEPCTVFGDPDSGYDDCVRGAICHHLDANNQGLCMALCGGSPVEPTCMQEDATCQICPDCASLCVPLCDPLAQDCAEGFGCVPDSGSFACHPQDQFGSGMLGHPCETTFQCQVGHACIDAPSVPGCQGVACCSPFCSTSEPICPQGMSCVPWFADLALLPNLGVCRAY